MPDLKPAPNVPPCILEPIAPVTPLNKPAVKPPIAPIFKASFKLPPCANVPMPLPNAEPAIMPNGVIDKPTDKTNGATFLTTLTTDLTAFFKPLKSFFRKNSGCPVTGLRELSSLPTTYCSGSMPIARICLKSVSFNRGFSSNTAIGTTVSPSAAWTM